MKLRYEFEIKGPTCEGCPLLRYVYTWNECICRGLNNKVIDTQVEYPSDLRNRPDWCPCKVIDE